jgi:hypothetical protein
MWWQVSHLSSKARLWRAWSEESKRISTRCDTPSASRTWQPPQVTGPPFSDDAARFSWQPVQASW